jgi:DNA repair protein RadC
VKRALELGASAIIMVHNHPSGDTTPSKADIEVTRSVARALATVGIALHDHIVIGRGRHSSFKSLGLLG